jgi:DNA polymerase I-like protein with 3'-5' exonuclease and polymerase domains/uracil-DNA glycosylase
MLGEPVSPENYDPEAHGALCQKCPLKGCKVVPPEHYFGDLERIRQAGGLTDAIAIIGEAPGEEEEKQGRPFIGRSGQELDKSLRAAGIRRRDTLVSNAILCRPLNNKLKVLLTSINKKNQEALKAAKDAGEKPPPLVPSPLDCCRPRLEAEIERFQNFITLGGTATKAVTGSEASIMAIRGGLMTLEATATTPKRYVMPTVHPAFVLRQMRWAHVFRNDLAKANRWFKGEADWVPPNVVYHPTPDVLRQFLSRDEIFVVDLETDGIEPLTAKIRCVGIGTATDVMVCGFLGKDGFTKFYAPAVEVAVKQVICEFLVHPKKPKAGHNFGSYDRTVLEQQWGVTPTPVIDTILIHRNVESELSHSLAYVASMYTTAPAWKTDRDGNKLSTGSESDEQLHTYNALDVAINARILPPLAQQLQLRQGGAVFQLDTKVQSVCVDMHTVGMYVDQARRMEEEKRLLKRRYELLHEIRDRLESTAVLSQKAAKAFNPGSVQQLSSVLFDRWQLEPPLDEKERLTGNGDPSTADIVLRSLLMDPTVLPERREIIKLLRHYRKVQKVIGTYVVKLRPSNVRVEEELGWDDDEDWVDKETRKKYGLEKMGIVNPLTGRMHPGWSPSVAVTGRLSSSKPINAMNFPMSCRPMVCAAPGNVLVGADYDQVEVRVAAARWGIERYMQAFREGKDPHSMTAFMIFGEAFCNAAGIDPACFDRPGILEGKAYKNGKFYVKTGEAYDLRHLSKILHFSCVSKDEPVVVLGPEGQKPISQLCVGDWTWTWSTQRKRYEPSEITAVIPRGERNTVRVTFSWWGGPRKGRCTESMVVTDDHRCLLRDGTYRMAGSLLPGDRLMPFRRRIKTSKDGRQYRWVFPHNTQEERAEYRCVAGLYDKDPTHVHHGNGNTLDDVPSNLEKLSPGVHSTQHTEAQRQGRVNSEKWKKAVSQPKVNLDPVKKAAAVAKRKATIEGKGGLRFSKLTPWADRIGHEPDSVIATESGVSPQAVYFFRMSRGIPAYWKEEKGGTNHEVVSVEDVGLREVWDIEVDHEDHNFALASGVFVHNSQYKAGVEQAQKIIASTEVPKKGPDGQPLADGTTDLPYALIPLRKVRGMRDNWMKGVPEYERGWNNEIETFRRDGFLTEPVTGRRRDFMDGENPNEIVNFPVQASVAGLMNLAMVELQAQIPRYRWGPGTGIIAQVHDWIGVECPESEAENVKKILEGCMNRAHDALPGIRFTAEAGAGHRWSEV